MTEQQFNSIVEDAADEGYAVGLRGQDIEFPEVGGFIDHQSSDWGGDELPEDAEQYDGVCTASLMNGADVEYALKAFRLFGRTGKPWEAHYDYAHVAIVIGSYLCNGTDEGEIVISDPEVAGIVR